LPAPNKKLSALPKQPLDRISPIQVRISFPPPASPCPRGSPWLVDRSRGHPSSRQAVCRRRPADDHWRAHPDLLRELVEAKTEGLATTPRAIAEPPKVINLMEALKRSLAQDAEPRAKEGVRKQTQASEGCSRPGSTGAATTRIRWSREDGRSCCGAGGFIGAKAKEESRVRPAPIDENTSPEKQERDHGSLVSKAQCGGIG
jgi:hypothetical protein